jgi:hypothetical protein
MNNKECILFIVDAGMDYTVVHRVDINSGKYLAPRKLGNKNFNDIARAIALLIMEDNCRQVIIDTMGIGMGVKDALLGYAKQKDDFIITGNGMIYPKQQYNLMGDIL